MKGDDGVKYTHTATYVRCVGSGRADMECGSGSPDCKSVSTLPTSRAESVPRSQVYFAKSITAIKARIAKDVLYPLNPSNGKWVISEVKETGKRKRAETPLDGMAAKAIKGKRQNQPVKSYQWILHLLRAVPDEGGSIKILEDTQGATSGPWLTGMLNGPYVFESKDEARHKLDTLKASRSPGEQSAFVISKIKRVIPTSNEQAIVWKTAA